MILQKTYTTKILNLENYVMQNIKCLPYMGLGGLKRLINKSTPAYIIDAA